MELTSLRGGGGTPTLDVGNAQISNNGKNGINVSGSLNIIGGIAEVSENAQNGIYVDNAHLTIGNDRVGTSVNLLGNGTATGHAGLNIGKNATVDIKDASSNIWANTAGIYMQDGASGALNIDNSNILDEIIRISNNKEVGLYIGDSNTANISNTSFNIFSNGINREASSETGADVKYNDTADGIRLEGNSTLTVQGSAYGKDEMLIADNTHNGLSINEGSNVIIKDMKMVVGGNGNNDIVVSGGKLDISSSNGWHKLDFDRYTTQGTQSHLVVQNGGTADIKNMDISVNVQPGGSYAVKVDQSTLNVSGENRNFYIHAYQGFLSNNQGMVQIENMNMKGLSGGTYAEVYGGATGIETVGGTTSIIGNGTNTMAFKGIFPENGALKGLYVTSSNGKRGQITIKDMDISFHQFTQAIEAIDSDISMSSNHNNVLYLSANGIFDDKGAIRVEAKTAEATMTVNGMRLVNENQTFADLKGTSDTLGQHTAKMNISNSTLFANNAFNHSIIFRMEKANLTINNTNIIPHDNYWSDTSDWKPSLALTFPYSQLIENESDSTFAATDSSLVGGITDNGSLNATMTRSKWQMATSSTVDKLTLKDSDIDLRNTGTRYNTLTVKNSLNADNVNVFMNVNLDNPSQADKIVLNDGARMTGSALLHITNTAPATSHGTFISGDGIKVVDALGTAATGAHAFDLAGKKIDTGAYVQELFYQNMGTNDESWYLRTVTEEDGGGNKSTNGSFSNGRTAVKTDLANSVAGMPVVALSVIKTINSELRNRLGELRSNNPRAADGLWARGYYKSLEVDENIKNEMDIYGFEAGYDHLIAKDAYNRTYLGLMAGYAQLDNLKIEQKNNHDGKGDGIAPSVGAYLTWVNKNGWYTDAVVRAFYTQMDITNYSAQGQAISHDADRMAFSGSLEIGRRSSVYQNGRNGFILEPKAQVAYTFMPSKDQKTSLGQKINYDTTNSLVTRGALVAAYRRVMRNGMVFEPYVQVGVAYEWLGQTDIMFDNAKFTSDVGGATFEGAVGLSARLSRGWHLYGDVNLEQGSVYKSWGGHLGVRYNF